LNLAGVFGFIKLNSAIIFGEFIGKRGLDEFKVRLFDENRSVKFGRDLKICRKLFDLKIAR